MPTLRMRAHLLLWLFLVTAELAPVAHLTTHRQDHAHGPEMEPAHQAAHRAGLPREHAADDGGLTSEERAWLFPGVTSGPAGVDATAPTTDPDRPSEHRHAPIGQDHGRDSVSHFGLAVLQAPPPPIVPAPSEAIAASADAAMRWHDAPALPQPPARGPPA